MSHLLGQQDCVDSLRRDLTDLQGTILEVFSRTGPVRSPSWKFPDKLSCNLDLVTILEQYDFVEGEEEFNQHSHIVLLELVVDRLLLLLQSFNSYTEVLKAGQWSGSHSGTAGPSMSIGLVVKRCWNNLLKLGTLHKLTLQEGKHQGASTLKPADELVISRDERSGSAASIKSAKSSDVSWPLSSPQNSSQLSSGHSLLTIARDIRTMGCQTLESSLVPCDACVCSQASLREVSDTLIAVCQNQNLPSSLSRFREVMDGTLAEGHLSASDLTYWATEQSKDLARLNKHLAELLGTVQPLKESLAASEAQQGDLRGQLKRAEDILMHERGEHQKRLRELELSLEEAKAKYIEAVSKLQGEQEMLRKGTLSLQERNSKLKEELSMQQASLQKLEQERVELVKEMRTRLADGKTEMECRLQEVDTQLSSTKLQMDKERAKYQCICRQQESMQAKQKALLQRVDVLDQECEELQCHLAESKEGRSEVEEKLAHSTEEKAQLQTQLTQQQALTEELQQEKQGLQCSVVELQGAISRLQQQAQEQAKRERLLVAFPELSPPSQCAPQSTGDIVSDMEHQLQANSVRIGILEEENSRLRNSLSKLRASNHSREMVTSPQPLWSASKLSLNEDSPGHPEHLHTTCIGDSNSPSSKGQELGIRRKAGPSSPGPWNHRSPAVVSPSSSSSTPAYRLAPALSLPADASPITTYSWIKLASNSRSTAARPKRK